MNEETEQIAKEEVVAEETVEETSDDGDGFEFLDDNMKTLIERQGTKLPKAEEVVEETEEVAEETVEETGEEATEEPEPLFVLEDGTKIMTVEEARKGFLLQSNYTKKRQEAVAVEREMEKYNDIIGVMKKDPKLTKMVIDYITGDSKPPEPQTDVMEVPEDYKNDPLVPKLIEHINKLTKRTSQLEGGYNTISSEKTAEQQRTDLDIKVNTRMAEAYNELKGQVETPPTPQEFMERIAAHFKELGLSAADAQALITSPDPTYLSAKVERIFAADISKVQQAKSTVVEKERKKRVAKTQALRVGGKSATAAPQSLPKGKDGKLDIKASLIQIQDAQDQLNRR